MDEFELREKKKKLISRMQEVCGKEYTFGWLQSAYVYPDGYLTEAVLELAFAGLDAMAEKKQK